jgi:hypothetical protein
VRGGTSGRESDENEIKFRVLWDVAPWFDRLFFTPFIRLLNPEL